MKVIIDANIFISSLINPKGKIADIILDPFNKLEKFSCHYLYVEILKHKDKILKSSKLKEDEFLELLYILIKKVEFYSEFKIKSQTWKKAEQLTMDIDNKDISYVALSMELNGYLWTGDKHLINGLNDKGFNKTVSTEDWFKILMQH